MSGRTRNVEKERHWRQSVREQAGSGLGTRAWCLKHGVELKAFYRWRIKLIRRDAEQPASFVPVHLTEEPPAGKASRIEIRLAGGRRLRISGRVDRQVLADVVAVLEGQAC